MSQYTFHNSQLRIGGIMLHTSQNVFIHRKIIKLYLVIILNWQLIWIMKTIPTLKKIKVPRLFRSSRMWRPFWLWGREGTQGSRTGWNCRHIGIWVNYHQNLLLHKDRITRCDKWSILSKFKVKEEMLNQFNIYETIGHLYVLSSFHNSFTKCFLVENVNS